MVKNFSDIFVESYNEYRDNFKVFFILILLLSFIPSLVLNYLTYPLGMEIQNLGINPASDILFSTIFNYPFLPIILLFVAISILLSIFLMVALTYSSLHKKKFIKIQEAFDGGKKYYFRFILYLIVISIFLIGLSFLFIIPAIIFFFYWIFSSYLLLSENKGIMHSLDSSFKLVKGRWWKTFFYSILFCLIYLVVAFGFSGLFYIVGLIISLFGKNYFIEIFLSSLVNFAINLYMFPMSVLFYKNLLNEYQKNRPNKK